MRLKVRRLWRAIKQELPIQFGHEQLTSYGGLELVRRYFQLLGLNSRIRGALDKHAGGDYGCTHIALRRTKDFFKALGNGRLGDITFADGYMGLSCIASDDMAEAMAVFKEKRAGRYRDR